MSQEKYIGMDVHQATISVAVGTVNFFGTRFAVFRLFGSPAGWQHR